MQARTTACYLLPGERRGLLGQPLEESFSISTRIMRLPFMLRPFWQPSHSSAKSRRGDLTSQARQEPEDSVHNAVAGHWFFVAPAVSPSSHEAQERRRHNVVPIHRVKASDTPWIEHSSHLQITIWMLQFPATPKNWPTVSIRAKRRIYFCSKLKEREISRHAACPGMPTF